MINTFSLAVVAALTVGVHAADVCGKTGYSSQDAYYYNDSDGQGNYAACSKLCLNDQNCKAFAFGSNTCLLFDKVLGSTFEADSTSPYSFYDKTCPSSAKSSSSTKSTSSTKATSTSSTKATSTSSTKVTSTTSTKATSTSTKATSTSSTKATSSSKAISSTVSASSVPEPSGCPGQVPTTVYIDAFSWTNTTHNCDCAASHPDVGDGTGCLGDDGNWCDPNKDKNCTHCGIGVCMTGLPPQPVGYGPPDSVTISVRNGFSCTQNNPQGFKPRQVGEEALWCGGSTNRMSFISSSNKPNGTATVTYGQQYSCTSNDSGDTVSYATNYQGTFNISCVHDAQFNATCKAAQDVIPLTLVSVG